MKAVRIWLGSCNTGKKDGSKRMAHLKPEHVSRNEDLPDDTLDVVDPEFFPQDDPPDWMKDLEPHIEWETFKNHFAKAVVNFQS
jgi:hypothetical protein